MEFKTPVTISKPTFTFSYKDPILLIGSCFAENIGLKLKDNKFPVDINPFGVIYNPASIASSIRKLLYPESFDEESLFEDEGVFHSFSHHSRFSSTNPDEALKMMNTRLAGSSIYLRNSTRIVVTFGTAYVYQLKSTGEVVSNCHKLPDTLFHREMMTIEQIVSDWKVLALSLWVKNPELKILFTVSPVRHWKDGAHQNQLSKATLLLAIDELVKLFPERISYFPAYEIVLDELRDYRFYAEDMLHISSQAIDFIWEKFCNSSINQETKKILKTWQEIRKAIDHKPFQPQSKAYKDFLVQTLLKTEELKRKFPYFDVSNEISLLQSKLGTGDGI